MLPANLPAMKRSRVPTLALAAFLGLAGAAAAQVLPFPGQPQPPEAATQKPDCTDKGVKAMEDQVAQLEAIEQTAPETIALFCTGIEIFADVMEWPDNEPLPDAINSIAKELLHQNLTPRMVKAMCRQAAGDTARNLRTEIGSLKAKLTQCKGI